MDLTLPRTLVGLREQVPANSIMVYCEGLRCPMTLNNITLNPSNERAWGLSGLLAHSGHLLATMPKNPPNFIFTLPCTCEVGPNFWTKVQHTAMLGNQQKYDVIALNEDYPAHFIGLWSASYAMTNYGAIGEVARNTIPKPRGNTEIHQKLKRLARGKYAYVEGSATITNERWDVLNDGHFRIAKKFEAFDIKKW